MALREELKRQGEFLFRHRSYLPLVGLALLAWALRDSEWLESAYGDDVDDYYDWVCVGLAGAGVALRGFVAGTVPGRTSGRQTKKGQVADELNTTGAYSLVRHPLYLANSIVILAFSLMPGVAWLPLLAMACYWLYFERVMYAEEEFLRSAFGARWQQWADTTPALIPNWRRWRAPSLRFSWRTALKREYLTVTSVVIGCAVVDYAEDLIALGPESVSWEAETTWAAAIVLAASFVVRALRKRTRILHVVGR
jgi:protein-S-isoprenylcysteine O-methyltransferase Ste14